MAASSRSESSPGGPAPPERRSVGDAWIAAAQQRQYRAHGVLPVRFGRLRKAGIASGRMAINFSTRTAQLASDAPLLAANGEQDVAAPAPPSARFGLAIVA